MPSLSQSIDHWRGVQVLGRGRIVCSLVRGHESASVVLPVHPAIGRYHLAHLQVPVLEGRPGERQEQVRGVLDAPDLVDIHQFALAVPPRVGPLELVALTTQLHVGHTGRPLGSSGFTMPVGSIHSLLPLLRRLDSPPASIVPTGENRRVSSHGLPLSGAPRRATGARRRTSAQSRRGTPAGSCSSQPRSPRP